MELGLLGHVECRKGCGFRLLGQGLEVTVAGFGFRVSGFGFRVSGFGFRVSVVRCSSAATRLHEHPETKQLLANLRMDESQSEAKTLRKGLGFRV